MLKLKNVRVLDEEPFLVFVPVLFSNSNAEHSLVSLSKWEEIWEKPFLREGDKEPNEVLSYFQCMMLNPNPPPDVLDKLTDDDVQTILDYIDSKRTATWFTELPGQKNRRSTQTITSELIYYWMICYQIPFQPTETWYLNRLFTLIRVCNASNTKDKTNRMSRSEAAAQRQALNEARMAKYGLPSG